MKRLLLSVWIITGGVATAAQDVSLEYRVKAAYLLNFTDFVEWPAAAVTGERPFTICVAQRNPFGSVLSSAVTGEQIAGRPLSSRVVQTGTASCQLLFVPRGVSADRYLKAVRGMPVLTVGEAPDFLTRGGIVNFVIQEGKVRFEINQEEAERAGLKVSSRLLRLAQGTGRGATP